ncbi:MAG: tetratricopeptide repeat protein [Candidatus Lindowbacteria bacterium]|nr:tetratricopeptide repeat protein [Candidatus Lindowbacteria bacterium]
MNHYKLALPVLLLVLAVAVSYANSLDVDFVYDDYAFVVNNTAIRTFTPLSKFFFSPEAFSQPASNHVYRPLASFTFALNYALNGLNPVGYHIVNLVFHTLNALLLLLLLWQIGLEYGPAFAAALLFAVHPVHTEGVTWISGRGNVLFLLFFLLAYLQYIKADSAAGVRRLVLLSGALAAYAVSLLAKEMALPLPAILFGHDLYFRRECGRKQWRRRLAAYAPFVIITVGYVLLRANVLGRVGQVPYHGGSPYVTFLLMLRAIVIYARLLFLPVGLSLSRHFQPHVSIFDSAVFPSFCLILIAGAVAVVTIRRERRISFALYWFAVTLLPVSNIIPVNAIVADRFLYGPSVAFCIFFGVWVAAAGRTTGLRLLTATATAAIVIWLALLCIGRNNDWKNTFVLWSKTAKSSPTSFVAFNNLGFEYMKRGQIPEAVEALNEAVKLKDDLPEPHINLARCYSRMGRIDEAIFHYKAALPHLEKKADTYYELGELYFRLRDMPHAADALLSALALDPHDGRAQELLKQIEKTPLSDQISD